MPARTQLNRLQCTPRVEMIDVPVLSPDRCGSFEQWATKPMSNNSADVFTPTQRRIKDVPTVHCYNSFTVKAPPHVFELEWKRKCFLTRKNWSHLKSNLKADRNRTPCPAVSLARCAICLFCFWQWVTNFLEAFIHPQTGLDHDCSPQWNAVLPRGASLHDI